MKSQSLVIWKLQAMGTRGWTFGATMPLSTPVPRLFFCANTDGDADDQIDGTPTVEDSAIEADCAFLDDGEVEACITEPEMEM